jgi:hypothetical protein
VGAGSVKWCCSEACHRSKACSITCVIVAAVAPATPLRDAQAAVARHDGLPTDTCSHPGPAAHEQQRRGDGGGRAAPASAWCRHREVTGVASSMRPCAVRTAVLLQTFEWCDASVLVSVRRMRKEAQTLAFSCPIAVVAVAVAAVLAQRCHEDAASIAAAAVSWAAIVGRTSVRGLGVRAHARAVADASTSQPPSTTAFCVTHAGGLPGNAAA